MSTPKDNAADDAINAAQSRTSILLVPPASAPAATNDKQDARPALSATQSGADVPPASPQPAPTPQPAPVPTPAAPAAGGLGFIGRVFTAAATLGPLGVRMPAPGTWGSAAGVLLYVVAFAPNNHFANWPAFLGLAAALNAAAIVICHIAEKHIGRADPSEVIFDEFAAMPLAYIGADALLRGSHGWAWFLAGFALFRLFDILKPFGIRKLQRLPGGLGIVADDVAAALAACATLHLLHLAAALAGWA